MPPKGASTAINPIRLQSITKLKINRPDRAEINPCLGPMSAMLTCWASGGSATGGCAHLENALKECMNQPKTQGGGKATVNYHLARLYPNIMPPKKRKGSLG